MSSLGLLSFLANIHGWFSDLSLCLTHAPKIQTVFAEDIVDGCLSTVISVLGTFDSKGGLWIPWQGFCGEEVQSPILISPVFGNVQQKFHKLPVSF